MFKLEIFRAYIFVVFAICNDDSNWWAFFNPMSLNCCSHAILQKFQHDITDVRGNIREVEIGATKYSNL